METKINIWFDHAEKGDDCLSNLSVVWWENMKVNGFSNIYFKLMQSNDWSGNDDEHAP